MLSSQFTHFSSYFSIASLMLAFLFLLLYSTNKRIKFWKIVSITYFFFFFGHFIRALEDFPMESFALIFSNSSTLLGLTLMITTVRYIKREWRFWKIDLICMAISVTIFIVISLTHKNLYEMRVAIVSIHIVYTSVTITLLAITGTIRRTIESFLFLLFGSVSTFFGMARFTAALTDPMDSGFKLELWDRIFTLWSLPGIIIFASAVFASGSTLILEDLKLAATTQERMTKKLKALLEEQEAMRKFVLHELRRPISNILMISKGATMMKESSSENLIEKVEYLAVEANGYLEAIGEINELSSLIENLSPTAFSISTLLNDVQIKWSTPVTICPKNKVEEIYGDYFLLNIALDNIIENAFKYGNQPSDVELKIRSDTDNIYFEVYDGGPGVPPHLQKRIFERFFKGGDPSNKQGTGMGLGLYIADQIAKAHGGGCCVLSQEPSIILFTIRLK